MLARIAGLEPNTVGGFPVNAENLAVSVMGITWGEFSERNLNSVEVLKQRLT